MHAPSSSRRLSIKDGSYRTSPRLHNGLVSPSHPTTSLPLTHAPQLQRACDHPIIYESQLMAGSMLTHHRLPPPPPPPLLQRERRSHNCLVPSASPAVCQCRLLSASSCRLLAATGCRYGESDTAAEVLLHGVCESLRHMS